MEKWIKDPRTLGADAVATLPDLIAQYPYCATYRLLYLTALANVHSTRLKDEIRRHAPAIPDRLKLFKLINRGEYGWIALMHHLEQQRRQQQKHDEPAPQPVQCTLLRHAFGPPTGSVTVMAVPLPFWLWISILPSWRWTIS